MAEVTGIIAGTSINKSNVITPDFDAAVYKFIVGQSGQNLGFTKTGSTLYVNGFAIADGVRAFFDNEQITIADNGYLYVKLTTHHDEEQADTAELEWSTTELTETHDQIGSAAGIYRMKFLKFDSGSVTVYNRIEKVDKCYEAETVPVVSSTTTGTTQELSDESTKIATTKYVAEKVRYIINNEIATAEFSITGGTSAVSTTGYVNSIKKQGRCVVCNFTATRTGAMVENGDPILTIPENYRPESNITIINKNLSYNSANVTITINTNGTVIINNNWAASVVSAAEFVQTISFNCGYVIDTVS